MASLGTAGSKAEGVGFDRLDKLLQWLAWQGDPGPHGDGNTLLTAQELAESLWLAPLLMRGVPQVAEGDSMPKMQVEPWPVASPASSTKVPPAIPRQNQSHSAPDTLNPPDIPRTGETSGTTALLPIKALPTMADLPVWLEDPRLIHQPLGEIQRLRDQWVPSPRLLFVDEEETVERSVRSLSPGEWKDLGLVDPVLRAPPEQRFDLLLAVDCGLPMRIWDKLNEELRNLFKNGRAFRDLWTLSLDDGHGDLRPMAELVIDDPERRVLVLLLSDCSGRHWWNGAIQPLLQAWLQRFPFAILQVLPRNLWERTALGLGDLFSLQNTIPGGPSAGYNSSLIRSTDLGDSAIVSDGPVVPVLSCDPSSLKTWGAVVMADRKYTMAGYRVSLSDTLLAKVPQADQQQTPDQQLHRFLELASPQARELAGLLAPAPVLTLPVMRLVKQALWRGDPTPLPMAEVLLSGLLQLVPGQEELLQSGGAIDELQFDFKPGLRPLLQNRLSTYDTAFVVNAVSGLVERRWSRFAAGQDFRAFLTDPSIQAPPEMEGLEAFANILAERIEMLGGAYAQFAKQLRHNLHQRKLLGKGVGSRRVFSFLEILQELESKRMIKLPEWLDETIRQAAASHSDDQSDTDNLSNGNLIARAFCLAYDLHTGQHRATGEHYIVHPIAVADLLYDIGASAAVIAAGLLHDVVEDTDVTPLELEEHVGAEVRALVEGVTKLAGIHYNSRSEAQAENLRRMFLAMAGDIRVVIVKLADRLHNMRDISALNPEKQQRLAHETREIFAPLANRLGIGRFSWELEDLAFKVLEPEAFREIQQAVATKRSEREERLGVTMGLLRERLGMAGLGDCQVHGRVKSFYSIWNKMQRKMKRVDDINDISAIRIICTSLDSCYKALAVVHDTFRPIPGRFRDYIGLPKPNGYQSLITNVIGRHRPLEVQICTAQMHYMAEYGIAAHWKYKEGSSLVGGDTKRYNWLRQLVDWQTDEGTGDSSDYLALIQGDLFDGEVFVFTPKGDVVGLPKGSTAVDFAYRIHSEVGNHCQAVKINDRLSPLATQLRNGDFVQVITGKYAHPSLDWLKYVVTPTSKYHIRRWFKQSTRDDAVLVGEELLQSEFGRDTVNHLLRGDALTITNVAHRFNLVSANDLLFALGSGAVTLPDVVKRLREELRLAPLQVALTKDAADSESSPILGMEGLDYKFGGCCSPLPGESIVGAVPLGNYPVTIHRQDCARLNRVRQERQLPATWNSYPQEVPRRRYTMTLRVWVLDRVGVLKDLLTRLAYLSVNVSNALVRTSAGRPARIDIKIEFMDVGQLKDVLYSIRSMPDVFEIARPALAQSNLSHQVLPFDPGT